MHARYILSTRPSVKIRHCYWKKRTSLGREVVRLNTQNPPTGRAWNVMIFVHEKCGKYNYSVTLLRQWCQMVSKHQEPVLNCLTPASIKSLTPIFGVMSTPLFLQSFGPRQPTEKVTHKDTCNIDFLPFLPPRLPIYAQSHCPFLCV